MVDDIANEIIERLKAKGFKIQRYDSISTNSIYLKLDYGVAHSIRISDHFGKRHLKYRFNIQSNIKKKYHKTENSMDRYFYGFNHVDILIRDIIQHRDSLMLKLGKAGYSYEMQKRRFHGQFKKGFWKRAEEV